MTVTCSLSGHEYALRDVGFASHLLPTNKAVQVRECSESDAPTWCGSSQLVPSAPCRWSGSGWNSRERGAWQLLVKGTGLQWGYRLLTFQSEITVKPMSSGRVFWRLRKTIWFGCPGCFSESPVFGGFTGCPLSNVMKLFWGETFSFAETFVSFIRGSTIYEIATLFYGVFHAFSSHEMCWVCTSLHSEYQVTVGACPIIGTVMLSPPCRFHPFCRRRCGTTHSCWLKTPHWRKRWASQRLPHQHKSWLSYANRKMLSTTLRFKKRV